MKKIFWMFLFGGLNMSGWSAEEIHCFDGRKSELTLIRFNNPRIPDKVLYKLYLDESLSCGYVGAIDGRVLTKDKSELSDVLGDSNGASWVTIYLDKGYLNSAIGKASKGFVKVEYDDMVTASALHVVDCGVKK